LFDGKGKIEKKSKTATIIVPDKPEATFKSYEDLYPVVEGKKGHVLMYKAVHKKENGAYTADYNKDFVYEVGKTYTEECAPASAGSCSQGLHIAHKSWARSFGISWDDFALLECEVAKKDIVVSTDTDGKVRCSKMTIIREVPNTEWYD
jgi:hypothetical protein